jgi:hypothetical protein
MQEYMAKKQELEVKTQSGVSPALVGSPQPVLEKCVHSQHAAGYAEVAASAVACYMQRVSTMQSSAQRNRVLAQSHASSSSHTTIPTA